MCLIAAGYAVENIVSDIEELFPEHFNGIPGFYLLDDIPVDVKIKGPVFIKGFCDFRFYDFVGYKVLIRDFKAAQTARNTSFQGT